MIAESGLIVGVTSVVLLLALFTSMFLIVIYSIHIFNTDFSKKQGYMPFLTPTSPYAIVASKLITTVFIAFIAVIIAALFGALDMYLVTKDAQPGISVGYMFKVLLDKLDGNWGSILLLVIYFIVTFLNNIIVIYLAITLTNSLLGESKLRGITSIGMWVAINVIMSVITKILTKVSGSTMLSSSLDKRAQSFEDLISLHFDNGFIIINTLSFLVITAVMYMITGWLANRKLSM